MPDNDKALKALDEFRNKVGNHLAFVMNATKRAQQVAQDFK
jgi:hypothetical protein